ncbi:MAG: Crp/Fnr family transcriptional regulator [Pyrinomonadaceae bacterium]
MNDDPAKVVIQNRLLTLASPPFFDKPLTSFKVMSFNRGSIICCTGDPIERCYFPQNGMMSLVSCIKSGKTIEVASIGTEGFVGFSSILGHHEMPYDAFAQSNTTCLVLKTRTVIDIFGGSKAFHDAALRFTYYMVKQLAQSCMCNHFHSIEARACRWFATMTDRTGKPRLKTTQESLADTLGARRTSIGTVTAEMQRNGMIHYSRGTIELLDIARIKNHACECYEILRTARQRLLDDFP